MAGKKGRSGGLRIKRMVRHQRPPSRFVGTATIPDVCLRERCGQQVFVSFPVDQRMPGTWHCPVGHSGVLTTPPAYDPDEMPPQGVCHRCRVRPVTTHAGRGGGSSQFCDPCIEEGRRMFSEPERRLA